MNSIEYKSEGNSSNKNESKIENTEKSNSTINFTSRVNLNYADFDAQKGSISPRYLYKKRKIAQNESNENASQLTETSSISLIY